MKKILYWITLAFLLCFFQKVGAQNISNEGSDFWLTFSTHDPSNATSLANMNVFVTSKNTSEVTVSCGTYSETKAIPANTIVAFTIPRTNSYINYEEGNKVLTNRAIHLVVTPGKPNVSAYAHVFAGARSAASLILPIEALGQKYYSMNFTQDASGNARNFLTLVAVEDNTKLILHQKNGTDLPISLLKKGDVYEYLPSTTEDLTGIYVEVDPVTSPCKKFAAFSGSTSLAISCSGSRDPIFQQLYTINSWGKSYGVVPFIDRRHILRVLAQEDNTKVYINGSLVSTLNKGGFYQPAAPLVDAAIVTSDKLISVAQYSLTQACSGITGGSQNGDPEMVLLNPTEFNIKNVTLFSASQIAITNKYINVFMKTAKTATFKLNGALPTNGVWKPVASDPSYSYIQIAVTQESLTLTADEGFNAIAYGFGNVESYAYSAGTNLASTQFLLLQNKVTNQETSAACIGQPVDFKVTLPYLLTKIIWKFNDGSPDVIDNNPVPTQAVVNGQTLYTYLSAINKTYTAAQKVQVSAIATLSPTAGSCSASDIEFIFNFDSDPLPLANFTANTEACEDVSTNFTDKSLSNATGKAITKWLWDFGDGTTSTEQNPAHIYKTFGNLTVKLSVASESGCYSDVFTKDILIHPKVVSSFKVNQNTCVNTKISFEDQSTIARGNIVKWVWDMGDGKGTLDKLNNSPFLYEYSTPGTYKVKLIAYSDKSCVSVPFELNVKVSVLPTNNFSLPETCLSDGPAIFVNTSKDVDGTTTNLTYQWDFGDPASASSNTSTAQNGSHQYTVAGTYAVTLTITNANGCVVVYKQDFVVKPLPTADFSVSNEGCEDVSISFTDKSLSNVVGRKIVKWLWDFGDGASSTEQNPTHIYKITGNIPVKLTVETETGCISTLFTKNILINPKVIAAFRVNQTTCVATQIAFVDQSTIASGNIVKWVWDMGDGTAAIEKLDNSPLLYQYTLPGNYTVKLIAHSNKGCISLPFELDVKVSVLPTNDFSLPDVCLSDGPAVFVNASKDVDGSTTNLTYLWNFGDPASGTLNVATTKDGTHKYNAAGVYDVTLTITNANGCIVKLQKAFTVNGAFPIAAFDILNASKLCSNKNISLMNTSTVDFGTVTKIVWYLDGVKHSEDTNPVPNKVYDFIYPQFTSPLTKNLTVKMVVYSGGICANEITKNLTILAAPVVSFDALAPVCLNNGSFQLQAKETGGLAGNATFTGPGVSLSGIFNPELAGVGTHQIVYTFTATSGCLDSKTQTIEVYPIPTVDAGADFFLLIGGEKKMEAKAEGLGITYKWTPSIGLDKDDILNPMANPQQDITYTLTVTSSQGCVVVDQVFVRVLQNVDAPNSFTPNGDGINDVWNIKYLDTYPNSSIEIYNRNGERIYYSKGYAIPFDGNYKNQPLPVGTYYYIINPNSGRKSVTGSLTIIR